MEDGKQGLAELLETKICIWELSVRKIILNKNLIYKHQQM